MKGHLLRGGRVWQRAAQLTAASLVLAGTGVVGGCLSRPVQPADSRTTSTVVARLTESSVDKIDLLLMIDNSRSMADKQQILVAAVPDLVSGLVNPKCLDPENPTDASKWTTPAGPLDPCPGTLKRDFNPVLDIHIGIVTSSIGGHGSDACPNSETWSCTGGATNATNNDMGHLVTRLDPCTGGTGPTYKGQGFLAWDPNGKYGDETEKAVGSVNIDATTLAVTTGTPGLVPNLKDLVLGTGQVGCGYEATMEGWYRFLVDPDPYKTISVVANKATPDGVDDALLQQRKDFLRPSSLLAIIGLTDENDCSIKEYGQFYIAAQQRDPGNTSKNFFLPKARTECENNPNDHCCLSTGQKAPADCPAEANTPLNEKTDDVNLRCWDQKRRYGIDFLYPVDRYVNALTQPTVPDRQGNMRQNPLFDDLDKTDTDSVIRSSNLVFMAYIVGVPWQDIAKDPADLTKGFKTAADLAMPDGSGHTTWDYIIGDPANYKAPLDPHMIESWAPRTGTNPITGDAISPPAQTEGGPNKLNGHEYTPGTENGVQAVANDLEYACIFKLPVARDCSDPNNVACDCDDPANDNPLCAENGAKGRTLQTHAKAYPGIRQLTLVKALGNQGIVGSICPAQLTNQAATDFGYRPAIGAIIDRLKTALGGQCLPRKLTPGKDGTVSCLILEARNTGGQHKADCDNYCNGKTAEQLKARTAVSSEHKAAVEAAKEDPAAKTANWDCFCEIPQLDFDPAKEPFAGTCNDGSIAAGNDLEACQCMAADPIHAGAPVSGWCYVDATTSPPTGNPDIVEKCPESEKRIVRFVGDGNPAANATLFITCTGE